MSERKVYTVSELTRQIRVLLENQFPGVWVEGEASVREHQNHLGGSSHRYFALKDENARLEAVIYSRSLSCLKFELKNGLKVICFGRISVYEKGGKYQISVERIEPAGLGSLQLALEQRKEKLRKEGLFDLERKRPIPRYPRKIGVITSPKGAAIRDILNILSRRFAGIHVVLNPVRVQGDGAAEEIAQALDEMNQFGDIEVLIVGRGGGSLEDLWAFNEEVLVRAIYRSRIPVVSAVGHEVDWTLADFVADLRAPTPSAAAELVTESRMELERSLGVLGDRMKRAVRNGWEARREKLESLCESYAFKQPHDLIEQSSQRLDELLRQLTNYVKNLTALRRVAFQNLMGKLEALSPLGVLSRGYSLTFDLTGRLVKTMRFLRIGDRLRTRLHEGMFESEVTKIDEDAEAKGRE